MELEIEILGARPRHAAGGGGGREAERGTRRIVVADADPGVRSYVRRCLEEHPGGTTEIVEATDRGEALRAAKVLGAHVVICDVATPVEGLALISELRADPDLTPTPVLLMTAERVGRSERERLERVPAVGLLEKPFNARKLRDAVERLLAAGERG